MSAQGDRMKALRDKRIAAALCIGCGIPATIGRSRCDDCANALSEAQKRYRAKLRGDVAEIEERIVVERITTPFLGRPIQAASMRTCPHCGADDITTIAQFGEDRLPSCDRCALDPEIIEVVIEETIAERAVRVAMRNPGMTAEDMFCIADIGEHDRDAWKQGLHRAAARGDLLTDGDGRRRTYYPAEHRSAA